MCAAQYTMRMALKMVLLFTNVNRVAEFIIVTDPVEIDTVQPVRIIKQSSGLLNSFKKNSHVIIL